MATAGSNLTEDRFLCSICLKVFTQPVSLQCGHNFCKVCITNCWNSNVSGLCQCPMCKETYKTRPELRVNCFISEMVEQFRKTLPVTEEKERKDDAPVVMFCDACINPKMKAIKSCLVCLTSYCETHLEPHHRVQTLRTHQLVEPLENMEDRMCKKHNKILELFCKNEQKCICMLCSQTDHRSHDVVALEDESRKRKAGVGEIKTECEQKIKEREEGLQKIRCSAEDNKKVTEKETADSVEVLDALVASIQRKKAKLLEVIERKQIAIQQEAEESITELQQEITKLQTIRMNCEKLSCSDDHFQVLSVPLPSTIPWRFYEILPLDDNLFAGTVRAVVTKMEKTLNEGMGPLIKQLEEHDLQVTSAPSPSLRPTIPATPPTPTPRGRQGSFHQPCFSIERHSSIHSYINRSIQSPSPKSATLPQSSIRLSSLQSPSPKSTTPTPSSIKLPPPPVHPKPDPNSHSKIPLSPAAAWAHALPELQQKLGDKKRGQTREDTI